MKKTAFAALATVVMFGVASCSPKTSEASKDDNQNDSVAKAAVVDMGEGFESKTNIRYIDQDRLMEEYHLGKDLHDLMVKNESEIQNYYNHKQAEIQKFGSEMENKYRNGGYLSEQSLKNDQQKLQKMQQDAEAGMAQRQQNYKLQVEEMSYNINTNIKNYIVEYNKTHHYDAILWMSAGVYFNPELDITNDIVEGLNKIYNQYHQDGDTK